MKWFANLPTPGKLLLAFGSMLLILAMVVALSSQSIIAMTHSVQKIHDRQFTIMVELQQLKAHLNNMRGQILEMMLTPDISNLDRITKDINEQSNQAEKIVDEISRLELDPISRTELIGLKNSLNVYKEIRNQEIALISSGKDEEARTMAIGVQSENFHRIRNAANVLIENAGNGVTAIMKEIQAEAAKSVQLCIKMGAFAFLIGFSMIIFLHFTMSRPLIRMSRIATMIAAGDLTTTVENDDRTDEVGILSQAFSRMTETLGAQIRDIMEGVSILASSSKEIQVSTSQMSASAVDSASGISETMTTVEEVRQVARLSSEKAKTVAGSTSKVVEVSKTGQNAVEETSLTMLNIRDQMESIAKTISRMSEQSLAIGGIIATVTDLADQSNLLAVNAAIEAAKAGEQGRGFVVVAQEIRNLAEQSKQATAQIRAILTDVQKTTTVAVMATEQGTRAVEAGVKQSSLTGEAVKILSDSSLQASNIATQIMTSSQQQVVGMDQIGVAMTIINQAGANNVSAMKQAETAAKNMNELGQKLRLMVDKFKLKGA